MHGTTSLLVPGIYDCADDSVTTYRKLEAVETFSKIAFHAIPIA